MNFHMTLEYVVCCLRSGLSVPPVLHNSRCAL